jgi:hypothetical protein
MDAEVHALFGRVEKDPKDDKALEALWQALAAREQWKELAQVVELTAQRRRGGAGAAELWFRAGELAKTYLKDDERAVRGYERAASLDGKHTKALAAARGIYLRQRRYGRASSLAPAELEALAGDAAGRARVLSDVCGAHGEATDASSKVALLQQLAARFPKDAEVPRALARMYRVRAGQPGGTEQDLRHAARILSRLAAQARGDERRTLAEEALDAWAGEEAAYAILEQALARDPEALSARKRAFIDAAGATETAQRMRRDLAEELRAAGNVHDAIAMLKPLVTVDPYVGRTLQELYRDSGRLVELDRLLAEAKAESPLDRVAVLRERAEIAHQRGEGRRRVDMLAEVLAIDPTDEAALAVVAEDLAARGAFADLRERYAAASRADAPAPARARWLREVARLSEERLGDDGAAIEAWLELAKEPDARPKLLALYEKARRFGELAELLETRVAEDADPKRTLLRAAFVRRDRMNDLAGAIAVLEKLAEQHPGDDEIDEALVETRLWSGTGDGLEETLKKRAEDAPPLRAGVRWAQLGRFLERDEARRGDAIDAFHKARTLDPTQSAAWGAEAALLEKAGRKDELLETLLAHAAQPVAATEQSRLPLLLRAARLALDLGATEKAVAAAEQASSWAPGNDEVSKLLVEVYAANDEGPKKPPPPAPVAEPVDEPAPLSRAGQAVEPPMISAGVAEKLASEHPPAPPEPEPAPAPAPAKQDIPEPPMIVVPPKS